MEIEPNISSIRVAANGLSFHVATCGDEQSDRLALCLHGFPESSFAFRYQLPMFARLGYRAWAPDLRGYGESSRPSGLRQYAVEKLEEDVAGLIDASGAKHVVLVGHDWGGGIAWNFAARRLRPLERLIILNSPHPMCLFRGFLEPRQLRRLWYMLFFQLPWLPEKVLGWNHAAGIAIALETSAIDKSHFPHAVTKIYQDNAAEPGALTAMLNYYRALPLSFLKLDRSRLQKIETKTLLLWGEADDILLKSMTVGTERYVDDLTVELLPNVSHWIQEEAPDRVNALIRAWLTGSDS
ncbi:MAG TPA: alpha/beta hydrolase [Polyangiales bacterium]|nr:alpha/beta hydrolase [Polyangiales bacterium]